MCSVRTAETEAAGSLVRWLSAVPEDTCYISVLTIGEVQKGIAKLGDTKRAAQLRSWVGIDLLERFSGRVLEVNAGTTIVWGEMCGEAERHGKTLPVIDSLIAATALHHKLTVVTRDDVHARQAGVQTINPWTQPKE